MERSNEDQVQGFWPVATEENVKIHQDLLQRDPSPPSNLIGDFMYGDDKPLSAEHFTDIQSFLPESNKNQVLPSNSTEQRINTQQVTVKQTEKSSPVKEVVNIRDSPVKMIRSAQKPPRKMRVMMLPFSRESKAVKKFPVDVDPFRNVEELRKELEKIQQQRSSELKLPEKGYFFIHKQRVLDDDQSFRSNGVAPGDTIEIFPGYVTHDGHI
ncbi:unnamed protein product [Microthlaspi erraticum]|uniref:Ubiquitin-like domain-containing protein n=1 Tax=Microthlaspi erraticum TaxID=1685480 RepID=A0A6D2K4U2_9BRAS|nr:unnamed protein product [Microthlaspi erraticum]